MGKIELKAPIAVTSSTGSVTAQIKSNLSTIHLQSAAYLTRQAMGCEQTQRVTESLIVEYRAYVMGAIALSIASIESTINELFLEAVHGNAQIFRHLQPNVPTLLCELWNNAERFSILDKYQLVLAIAQKERFEKGSSPYQEVDSAIVLRNALIHYKPEWDRAQRDHKKIEDRLRARFEPNPFSSPEQAFFPHRCLSHGCAVWVVTCCIKFIEDFYGRLGLDSKWKDGLEEILKTQ
jgi:hypothetical protein